MSEHRDHRIFLCTWFVTMAGMAWYAHIIFDALGAHYMDPTIYWSWQWFMAIGMPLTFPNALKEGRAQALRLFLLIGPVIWFLHPVGLFTIEPQFYSYYTLTYSVVMQADYLSTYDWLIFGLHTSTFLLAAFSLGGFSRLFQSLGVTTRDIENSKDAHTAKLADASWASEKDVADNFNHKGGIVIGEHTDPLFSTKDFRADIPNTWGKQGTGRLMTINPKTGNSHVFVTAESSGFKTSGLIISNLTTYDGPITLVDPKADLFARTCDTRRSMGFNPIKIDAETGFDPFKLIEPLAKQWPEIYLTVAKAVIERPKNPGGNGDFFYIMSVNLFAALIAELTPGKGSAGLEQITDILAPKDKTELRETLTTIIETTEHEFVRVNLRSVLAMDDKRFTDVTQGVLNYFSFALYPTSKKYITSPEGRDEFAIGLDPKTDIYINIPTTILQDFAPMVRLLMVCFFQATMRSVQPDRPLSRRLYLLDEAKALHSMEILKLIRDEGRAYGMHLMLIYQSFSQVVEIWNANDAAAWKDSCQVSIFGASNDNGHAEHIKKILGTRTISASVQSKGDNQQKMSLFAGQRTVSESEQLKDVPLLDIPAISKFPLHGSIILASGSKPILATKAIYFTRKDMKDAVKSPDDVSDNVMAEFEALMASRAHAADTYEDVSAPNIMPLDALSIHPSGKAYDPVGNGFASDMRFDADPFAEWAGEHIEGFPTSFPSHLVFENFNTPPLPVFPEYTALLRDPDAPERKTLMNGIKRCSALTGTVSALKRHRQPLKFSKEVQLFLDHYSGIPQKTAYLVRATFLGASLPFKLAASCVWEDTIEEDGRAVKRLFRQPVTINGFPLGVAQSWPITEWNDY